MDFVYESFSAQDPSYRRTENIWPKITKETTPKSYVKVPHFLKSHMDSQSGSGGVFTMNNASVEIQNLMSSRIFNQLDTGESELKHKIFFEDHQTSDVLTSTVRETTTL